jgi:hypothetical protein
MQNTASLLADHFDEVLCRLVGTCQLSAPAGEVLAVYRLRWQM